MIKRGLFFYVPAIYLMLATLPPACASTIVLHQITIYAINRGNCSDKVVYAGYAPSRTGNRIYPCVLRLVPDNNWTNYITAAHVGVPYTLKSITLTVSIPSEQDLFKKTYPKRTIVQKAAPDGSGIRTQWPLLYGLAGDYMLEGTTWTLSILYKTDNLWDDDGPAGCNPPAWVHVDQWVWTLKTDCEHIDMQIDLFRDLPFGSSNVPLISVESKYHTMKDLAMGAIAEQEYGFSLSDLGEIIYYAPIAAPPPFPVGRGLGTGIAETSENPACHSLMTDIWSLERGCP